jgi:indolepyruvate ferredoxin oxidoreductase beta subunit
MRTYNIIFAGVGGQGVITVSQLLARAALSSGLDVRMYGNYGMSQRGGSVSAHLRLGKKVINARIERGEAHLLVGLELLETVRQSPLLASGARLIAHNAIIMPTGKMLKGIDKKLTTFLGEGFPGSLVIDAAAAAGTAGLKGMNAVLLGAASKAPGFPVKAAAIEKCIREDFGERAGPVLEAFKRGLALKGK